MQGRTGTRWSLFCAGTCLCLCAACTGSIGDPNAAVGGPGVGGGAPPVAGGSQPAGPPPSTGGALPTMRRLTATEYNNTVADLLADTTRPADGFDPDGAIHGFSNQIATLDVSATRAQQYMGAAERLAAKTDLGSVPCVTAGAPAGMAEEFCATEFARAFGKRAYRRPLTADEVSILITVFKGARAGGDFAGGLRQMVQAMLVAPQFLYRIDVVPGASVPAAATTTVDAYQMASRLSYTFLQSMPDAELFAAADSGRLSKPDEIAAQVKRLMLLPRARAMVAAFNEQWLSTGGIEKVDKSATLFPQFAAARAALRQELETFLDDVFWNQEGRLSALLSSNYSFRNATLAAFYGDGKGAGAPLAMVNLAPDRSAGLLTQGGLLAALATPDASDPVARGLFVRRRLLCQDIPPPPPGVNAVFPKIDPASTTRQRFAQHESDPACAACHLLMDGIGLGFENFDAAGRWRTTENGKPIDPTGSLSQTDVDGPFAGVVALGKALASSRVAQECVAKTWFRFIAGRDEAADDAATIEQLRVRLTATAGGGQKGVLEEMAQTVAFRSRVSGGAP